MREALSARLPKTGLCVLHQRARGALPFLKNDIDVEVEPFKEPDRAFVVAEKRDPKDEILLGYPETIDFAAGQRRSGRRRGCRAVSYTGLSRGATSRW